MAEMTDLVIVNRALAMIGEDALQSLGDETPGGQKAALLYESTLDFCLGLIPWGFLRQTKELNRLALVAPKNGYAFAYQLPDQTLRPERFLAGADAEAVITAYEIEGDQFHCNEAAVFAQLSVRQAPHMWSGAFRHAFTKALAAEFATSLAHDKNLSDILRDEAFGSSSMNFRGGLMGAAIQADSRMTPVRHLALSNPLMDAWSS